LSTPRPGKGDLRQPSNLTVGTGGATSKDSLADVYEQLGRMHSSITYLEAHADDAKNDLKTISGDIIAAKATFKTLKIVFGVVGTICVGLWALMTGLMVMMAKHYLGW
jgi:hypothetical protein